MDKIPYVIRIKDRYGNERLYYRRFGHHIRLTAAPGSVEFYAQIKRAADMIGSPQDGRRRSERAVQYVYFVLLNNSRVKIGVARDANRRFKTLRTAIPGKARIYYVTPGGRELEQELHRLFAADRVSGEWFIYSDAIREWIKADEARRIELRVSRDVRARPQLKVVK